MPVRAIFAVAALAVMLGAAHADDIDPAELAFWQSIQSSTNPAEYQAYLQAFPKGRFAAIARIRAAGAPAAAPPPIPVAAQPAAGGLVPPPIPGGQQPPAVPPPQPAAYEHPEKIILTPPNLRVGEQTSVSCLNFPNPTGKDVLIVVAAGTPDVDINNYARLAEIKILWKDYAVNCGKYAMKAGPFAPGAYEIRFMTQLYNNDGVAEVATRTPFSVR